MLFRQTIGMSEESDANIVANAANAINGGGGSGGIGQGQLAVLGPVWPSPVLVPPVQNFNYFFNSALSFQQNGYCFQNFGPPPKNMWGLTQNGPFGPQRFPFGPAAGGVIGGIPPFGFQQLRQPLSLETSGAMYGPKPTPTMTVASNYPGDGTFRPNAVVGVANISPLGGVVGVSGDSEERFSRKVFIGGLPPDIDELEITASFLRFGAILVDWPTKTESKSYFPPKGYAFLVFQQEASVQHLINACIQQDNNLYYCVSSPSIKDKPVQIRPWRLSDAEFVVDPSWKDPRKTVFIGGIPRTLKAVELAIFMNKLFGGVCYARIETEAKLKYPKGCGRVVFSSEPSYIAAIRARFVELKHGEVNRRVEVKPYILEDQLCDGCGGGRCGGKFAPYFCANVTCLQYYCEHCWVTIHSLKGREYHKPIVKEGANRPKALPFCTDYFRKTVTIL